MKDAKIVFMDKNDFEKLDQIIDNICGILGGSRIASEKNIRTKGSLLTLPQKLFRKQKKSRLRFLIETSVHHGFDINLNFSRVFKTDQLKCF